jgi:hypothetical protein
VRAAYIPKPRKSWQHGTFHGATKGCKTDCPAELEGGESCTTVRRRSMRENRRTRSSHGSRCERRFRSGCRTAD